MILNDTYFNPVTMTVSECKQTCIEQCTPYIYTSAINNYLFLPILVFVVLTIVILLLKYRSWLIEQIRKEYPIDENSYSSMLMVFIYVTWIMMAIFLILFKSGIRIYN